jgi:cytochrome c-type protein NapB
MRKLTAIMLAGGAAFAFGVLQAGEAQIDDDKMGLSKTSVFDDPSPEVFDYPKTDPSSAQPLPRAWEGAPPQIPHKIDAFVPIMTNKNLCVNCHDKPTMLGKKKVKGIATPMSEAHYVKAEDGKLTRSGGRFVCTQCHTPQAQVNDLVGNSF